MGNIKILEVKKMVYDDKKQEQIMKGLDDLVQEQKNLTYINPNKADDLDALGILVAKKCKWDSGDILKVLCSALEDANFDDLRDKIKDIDTYSSLLCKGCVGTFSVDKELIDMLKQCPYCGKDKFQKKGLIKIGGEKNENRI